MLSLLQKTERELYTYIRRIS
ncbi:hypothetical protein BUE80_DR013968 [Diplocarpon rosae]|nr:hypothetical protein BUE80_DR013968 [Diplocarpon rosae]